MLYMGQRYHRPGADARCAGVGVGSNAERAGRGGTPLWSVPDVRQIAVLPLLFALTAQATPSSPMPKGTGLPPPTVDEAAVLTPINRLFAAMANRDAAAFLAQLRSEGGATVAIETSEGNAVSHRSWAKFAETLKPGKEKFEERLINPAVDIDGDIAMVWSRYVYLIDGKLSHCGMDHFDLVRENGSWKILNITWSKRTTGCTAE